MPHDPRQGGQGQQRAGAHRLLHGEAEGRAGQTQTEEDAGKSRRGAAGRKRRGDDAGALFFTGANVARVNVAMELPAASFNSRKDKGKLRSTLNVLAIAYKKDGSVARG